MRIAVAADHAAFEFKQRPADELVRLGLDWDGEVVWQSADPARYLAAVSALRRDGLAFGCGCSRRDLRAGVYPGTCRDGIPGGRRERSVRLRVNDDPRIVDDGVQGAFRQHLESSFGDFVILRADGIVAYHLATVMDDAEAGISHVIRGADLLDSTPRQILLQESLGLPVPGYAHLPVARNRDGQKLSKQTHAPAVSGSPPPAVWQRVLEFLGHPPPAEMEDGSLERLRDWALDAWDLARVPAEAPAPCTSELPA